VFLASVDPASVAEREILHDLRQRHLPSLDRQVAVIDHGANGIHPVPKPFHTLLQQQLKVIAVLVTAKDRLSTVTAEHDVIETTGKMKSGLACHDKSLGLISKYSTIQA